MNSDNKSKAGPILSVVADKDRPQDEVAEKVQDFLDQCVDGENLLDDFTVQWSRGGIGFGEFSMFVRDGQIYLDSEAMSKAFIKDIMNQLIDNAIIR